MPLTEGKPGFNHYNELIRFCTRVHDTIEMPSVIEFVAGNAEFVDTCRDLALESNPALNQRVQAICKERLLDTNRIQSRVKRVALALQLIPGSEIPPDYYEILGVSPEADARTIKRAFWQKAKTLHPDKQLETSDAFIKLNAAYQQLINPRLRSQYDEQQSVVGNWVEKVQTPKVRSKHSDSRKLFASIGALLTILVAAAFAFETVYNETSYFEGRKPAGQFGNPTAAVSATELQSDTLPVHPEKISEAKKMRVEHRQTDLAVVPAEKPLPELKAEFRAPPRITSISRIEHSGVESNTKAYGLIPPSNKRLAQVVRKDYSARGNDETTVSTSSRSSQTGMHDSGASEKPTDQVVSGKKEPNGIRRTQLQAEDADLATLQDLMTSFEQHPLEEKTGPPLGKRLETFFDRYCEAYASKDIEKFSEFFSSNATEQGLPITAVLPAYQETFDQIKQMQYEIEPQSFAVELRTGVVHVSGLFEANFELNNGDIGKSSGTITMSLSEDQGTFRILSLGYTHE